jgi:hypothetical protein
MKRETVDSLEEKILLVFSKGKALQTGRAFRQGRVPYKGTSFSWSLCPGIDPKRL